jgi:hypothetical protein
LAISNEAENAGKNRMYFQSPALSLSDVPDLIPVDARLAAGSHEPISALTKPLRIDPNLTAVPRAIFPVAGAFLFQSGSKDSAGLFLMHPGA